MSKRTYKFHVPEMHCKACVLLTEENLKEAPGVLEVRSDFVKKEVMVTGNFGETADSATVVRQLEPFIKKDGYSLLLEKAVAPKNWSDFFYALPIAVILVIGFVLLQRTGLVNLITTDKVGFGTAFLIGLIASVSSCLAVVGGLVLSLSAAFAKEGETWRPQTMFHVGRIGGFFILGGTVGALGSAFQLGPTGSFVLTGLVTLVMIVLGLNLLEVFDFTKRFQVVMPKFIGRKVMGVAKNTGFYTPLLAGVLTFFLPCGFTQSMQIYSLSTGSFFSGAMTMSAFALGTLPVLSLLSFSSWRIQGKGYAGIFFKAAGLIVVALAIFNLVNSFVVLGLIRPVFNL
jgi:uncharacterized protein